MNFLQLASIAVALGVGLAAPFGIRPLLEKAGALDVPNNRSSHTEPVLRGGGLAPLAGLLAGIAILIFATPVGLGNTQLLVVLLVSAAGGSLGMLEDFKGVRISMRAGVQFLLGALATSALVSLSGSDWWWIPIGAFVFAGYTNAANFMDGINAVSSLHGVVVGLAFVAIGALADIQWIVPAGLVLAVSFASFLPWNLRRNRIFLGDVGSYLLGGSIGVFVIAAVLEGAPVVAVLGPLAIYLADTGSTLLTRILRGDNWQQAHRSHVYQRLTDTGLSHVSVALAVTGATLVTSALGLLAFVDPLGGSVGALLGIAIVSGAYLALPRRRGWRASPSAPSGAALLTANPTGGLGLAVRRDLKWAIVGASGFIGAALATELRAHGCDVVAVVAPRLLLAATATAADVREGLRRSVGEVEELTEALAGANVVVNAAGLALPGAKDSDALFGGNSLLPLVIFSAAEHAHIARFVHLSSAAVQGRRMVLDESTDTSPFSPYSRSKALGEEALLTHVELAAGAQSPQLTIIRATSVQGAGRTTTGQLRRLARSPLASVAQPGNAPTVVSSLRGLVEFVAQVGSYPGSVPAIVLQPWEGMTTSAVLESAGAKSPLAVPSPICRSLIAVGYATARKLPPLNGPVRRVELMWLGQDQDAHWARSVGLERNSYVADVLTGVAEKTS